MEVFKALVFSLLVLRVNALPEVWIKNTNVIGSTSSGVDMFLGLPFAKPPVGNFRLRPPVLTTTLTGKTFDATSFGFSCPQIPSRISFPINTISEDCLTLNVFRPSGTKNGGAHGLPVMIFIYGGGPASSSSSIFNGVGLVSTSIDRGTPVIYVSFNYRLGPLGYPTGNEAASKNILNLGLQDQVAALEWLKENIGAFGGDKNKVTVFGESAGAASISLLLVHSKIDGLARAAILESPASLPISDPRQPQGDSVWSAFVSLIPSCASSANGTGTIDCIRQADPASVVSAAQKILLPFFPTLDGPHGLVPNRPSKTGFKSKIPLIVGSNIDEGTIFTPQTVSSDEDVKNFFLSTFSPPIISLEDLAQDASTILELYPDIPAQGSPFGTGNDTFGLSSQYKRAAAIFGDILIESYRRTISQDFSRRGVNVWGYQFADPNSPFLSSNPVAPGSLGVTHANELPYVFGNLLEPSLGIPSAEALSKTMQNYWISFATTLDPNDKRGVSRPNWKKYTFDGSTLLRLNGTSSEAITDDFRAQGIAFFQSHPDFSLR